ncbi:FixH family protein [Telmatospirillum sp.]|uniref:FixH family protein n=1 Tax=Telmatospirillum sp. TaxID=2079197 RepID=UPI00283F4055|nr:FixH family protein [Telmatospirillum sp.]MDR3435771.1 FixH family protein [Telmatospirillum sp.]
MGDTLRRRLAIFAAACAVLAATAGSAFADPKDYRFEAVQPHVKAAADTVVSVRLIHIPDNKPVADAVIFSAKMEMPMAGMAPMVTKVAAQKSTKAGEYPFQTDFSAGGDWTLTLSAKVQGETGVVSGSVPFMAMK